MNTTTQTSTTRDVSADDEAVLPEGWVATPIRDIVNVNYGRALKESDRKPGHVSVFGSNGRVGEHNNALTLGPTIIIGEKGTVGAVHFSSIPCWPIDTTYFIDQFQHLDERFLKYSLGALSLSKLDTSTAIPGLNREDLYAQELLLPPLDEQPRIVGKIEELLKQVTPPATILRMSPKS